MATMTTVGEKIEQLQETKNRKTELTTEASKLGDLIDQLEREIIADMNDLAEASGLTLDGLKLDVGNKRYGVMIKNQYSIKAEDRDAGFAALRNVGLGYLITQQVRNDSLTKALREAAEDNGGELPPEYGEIPLTTFSKPTLVGRATGRK